MPDWISVLDIKRLTDAHRKNMRSKRAILHLQDDRHFKFRLIVRMNRYLRTALRNTEINNRVHERLVLANDDGIVGRILFNTKLILGNDERGQLRRRPIDNNPSLDRTPFGSNAGRSQYDECYYDRNKACWFREHIWSQTIENRATYFMLPLWQFTCSLPTTAAPLSPPRASPRSPAHRPRADAHVPMGRPPIRRRVGSRARSPP